MLSIQNKMRINIDILIELLTEIINLFLNNSIGRKVQIGFGFLTIILFH